MQAGYFARVLALRGLLEQFFDVVSGLDASQERQHVAQVLSLGAGFDTTFFNIEVKKGLITLFHHTRRLIPCAT